MEDLMTASEHQSARKSAIDNFLDEIERIGVLQFRVPQTDRANSAIVALYDSVGRNP